MAKTEITNMSREPVSFHVGNAFEENGEPKMDHVDPGEKKSLDIDLESAPVRGMILAGLITVPKQAEKAAAKPVVPAA